MELLQQYDSDTDSELNESYRVRVGGDHLERFLLGNKLLKDVNLQKEKRNVKLEFCSMVSNHDAFNYTAIRKGKEIRQSRNRYSDVVVLNENGIEKQKAVRSGLDRDCILVSWKLYCPGKGNCQRQCGGLGECLPGCDKRRTRHDKHACSVHIRANVMASDNETWLVKIHGYHTPPGVIWDSKMDTLNVAEFVKEKIVVSNVNGMKPFGIYRQVLAEAPDEKINNSRLFPSTSQLRDFIKNHNKGHSYKSGQWSAVHSIMPELKAKGIVLFYQLDNPEANDQDMDQNYILSLSDSTALCSARKNQPIMGLDGKHGLQDDGACLMTSVTQHASGLGCPTAFTIVNKENTTSMYLTLRSIIENVPCENPDCDHPFQYFSLPDNRGFRRHTPCSFHTPYRPMVMIDKHIASANACTELGLPYVLCWFHAVKAIMEKLKALRIVLIEQYLIVLGFKIVARSPSIEVANQRWNIFLEMLKKLSASAAIQNKLEQYFREEWWCDKWRLSWLDLTRMPLTENGTRSTMTTNNHDENLNLKITDCMGGRRKKVSTLVYEITGVQARKENSFGEPPKKKKASLLETHAALTLQQELSMSPKIPRDIIQRTSQAQFVLLTGDVIQLDANKMLYAVPSTGCRDKRFRDHKGNWITVTLAASAALDDLLNSLIPLDCTVPRDMVLVDLSNVSCTCTDHLWRSSMRDPCHHIKAARLHNLGLQGNMVEVISEQKIKLAKTLRRQQFARPREGRNLNLISDSDEVVIDEMKDLFALHGWKIWDLLSTVVKSDKIDHYRPKCLPKDKSHGGKPKERNAKPRPANPFRRSRNLLSLPVDPREFDGQQRKPQSVKRIRNCKRRLAQKLIQRSKKQGSMALKTRSVSRTHTEINVASTSHQIITRTSEKHVKSPCLTRGEIIIRLAKTNTSGTPSTHWRLAEIKPKGPEFVSQ